VRHTAMSGQPVLQTNHLVVLEKIHEAERNARRVKNSVRLLAVSKTFPCEAVLQLADLGQRAFGENYVQEAVDKIAKCADQRPDLSIEWHFIGPIQSNKTKPIAEKFAWVHSIEREKIAQRLNDQRPTSMPPLNVCIQLNVSGEVSKSGCAPSEVMAIAKAISALPNLSLRGVMAIPEATQNDEQLRLQFGLAQAAFNRLNHEGYSVDTLSIGMSADLDVAIACGATIVRIGSAIFGKRTYPSL
jgi:PLP dependent protein